MTDQPSGFSPSVARPTGSLPPDFAPLRSQKRRLVTELRDGWEAGQPVAPEELLARWPGDPEADPDVASLLFEDFCQRRQRGETPSPADYSERFPGQHHSLASLVQHQELLRSLGGASVGGGRMLALPAVGDQLFGFQLTHELGRGSFARVFLARQTALASRPVVLKVSAIDGDEPQTLAQLQHTHIVPIYSVHEDEAAGLRALCMPYFGGASLARVLQALWAAGGPPANGAQLVGALDAVQGPWEGDARGEPTAGDEQPGSPLAILRGLAYVRAAAWIVARLAEGLQHAHQRGVLHRDMKPSNVLLGADGQPMLLDFNLAQSVQDPQAEAAATLGGTVAYMAPEHLRALAARDPALVRVVDHRADLYGLGMVLYEMLTGRRPFDQSGSYSPMPALIEAMAVERSRAAPSLRQQRADVPWGLESIARKCLAPDPAARYQQAEHLAEDLRRFLDDRPLRHAPELSQAERVQKWVRRHPRLAAAGSILAATVVVLAAGAVVLAGLRARLRATEQRAYEAEGAVVREQEQAFVAGAQRARCLLNTTTDWHDHLEEGLAVCEKALAQYGILDREDGPVHVAWHRLDPGERRLRADDARELLLLLARARVRRAPSRADPEGARTSAACAASLAACTPAVGGPLPGLLGWAGGQGFWGPRVEARTRALSAALHDALALLDQAENLEGLGPSPALWRDRADYLERLGDASAAREARARAQGIPATSARDHYLLASSYAQQAHFAQALTELKQARDLNPQDYWSWFHLGMCHYELGEPVLAVGDFSACIGLWPDFAWGHFNRGQVLQRLGKYPEAREDYTAALRCDPELADARLNRGLLCLQQNEPQAALSDLEAACARPGAQGPGSGLDRFLCRAHAGRGIALEGLGRPTEADTAFRQAWRHNPDDDDMLLGYGFAVVRRLPQRAQDAFLKVLGHQPRNPRALYGYAMLLAQEARRSEAALALFTLALEADPTFVAARLGRANVLAHRGEGQKARQEVDWCVKAEPTGRTLYAAACVYALLTPTVSEQDAAWLADKAVGFLRGAFARGYGKDKAAADSDLAALRGHPEFRRLLRSP